MSGFVKLHRKLFDWEWYSDINVRIVFLHLLLKANWKDSNYKGIIIKRGQVIIGNKTTPQEIGVSVQKFRTAINKLKSTREITHEATNQFTVLTLVNYDNYQSINDEVTHEVTREITNQQQTDNKRITTSKEVNNLITKEIKESIKKTKKFSPPSILEIEAYMLLKTKNKIASKNQASKFFNYYESKGWLVGKVKMKKWQAAASGWISRQRDFDKPAANLENGLHSQKLIDKNRKYD